MQNFHIGAQCTIVLNTERYKGLKTSYINDTIKLEGLGVRNTDLQ